MLSAKFALELLEARDQRQDALARVLREGHPTTLFLSLNIPGADKAPPGSSALFAWMQGRLAISFPDFSLQARDCNRLGDYLIAALTTDSITAKRACIGLEESHPAARLIDLDIYSGTGVQVDRASLDLPGRACLHCARPAVECMRSKRHSLEETIGKAHELLSHFRP